MCVSDAALVVEVDEDGELALVEMRGTRRRVSVALLTLQGDPVSPGDWLLASAGMAVARLDETEATALAALVRAARADEDG